MTWLWSLALWSACSPAESPPDEPTATATAAISTVGAVLTQHNDIGRTGLNNVETRLTQGAVATNFGKLFTIASPVGKIYAQPLYAPAVTTPSGVHNLLIIATEANNVYALDATTGTTVWSFNAGTPIPAGDEYTPGRFALGPTIGITGTPVINPATGVIYFVASTKTGTTYQQKLHALNIADGTPFATPHAIVAQTAGDGPAADANGQIHFDPLRQNQRAALLLQNGTIYVAWASHDSDMLHSPKLYEGWLMSFDATSLQLLNQFTTNVHASFDPLNIPYGGGIWMAGGGPASDGTRIFVTSGNGASNGSTVWADNVLALDANLSLVDFFRPGDAADLEYNDFDFSAGGVVVLPDAVPGHSALLGACGKAGDIYLLDRNALGEASSSHLTGVPDPICPTNAPHCVVAEINQAFLPVKTHGAAYYGLPALFNHRLYYVGWGTHMQLYSLNTGGISDTGLRSATTFQYPGATPSISSNGLADPIVWAIERTAVNPGVSPDPSHLHAYNATNLTELYGSSGDEDPSAPNQFQTPTIAGGRVYVAGTGIDVYGTLLNVRPVASIQAGHTITLPLATAARPTLVTYNLTAQGTPTGLTVSFSPATLTSGATTTIALTAATSLLQDAYVITLVATNPANGHALSTPLVVSVLPD
jgi:hypothetical protein